MGTRAETTPRWLLLAAGCTLCFAVCGAITHSTSASSGAGPPWPLWGGAEPVKEYARRAGLPPARTLDLGRGVKLELTLVPAGKFVMGTPKPEAVDEESSEIRILVGRFAVASSVATLLVLLGTVVIRAVRQWRRPQYSLARFVAMILTAGVGVLGATHWWHSVRALAEAKAAYQVALARYKDADETGKPGREVTIAKPFYLGKYEVKQQQYAQVMGTNPSHFKGQEFPVDSVCWYSAQDFCKKVGEQAGVTVRLPTEAEWEHACRAGTRTAYCTGDTAPDLDQAGWYEGNSGEAVHVVGRKAPNAWGLYDMHGNVWEWCQDWFGGCGAVSGPQDTDRVLRGGSWLSSSGCCRSAVRGSRIPELCLNGIGFRVAVAVPSRKP
jgi:hypothetical protein